MRSEAPTGITLYKTNGTLLVYKNNLETETLTCGQDRVEDALAKFSLPPIK